MSEQLITEKQLNAQIERQITAKYETKITELKFIIDGLQEEIKTLKFTKESKKNISNLNLNHLYSIKSIIYYFKLFSFRLYKV